MHILPLLILIAAAMIAAALTAHFLAPRKGQERALWVTLGIIFPPAVLILLFMKDAQEEG